jgi:hypothetical protein
VDNTIPSIIIFVCIDIHFQELLIVMPFVLFVKIILSISDWLSVSR